MVALMRGKGWASLRVPFILTHNGVVSVPGRWVRPRGLQTAPQIHSSTLHSVGDKLSLFGEAECDSQSVYTIWIRPCLSTFFVY